MKVRLFLVLISAFCLLGANAQTSINLSHDLVRLGIASQNLSPDSPSLDARPLFQAAQAYASNHGTQLITLDRGSYYFLTAEDASAYLRFSAVSDFTVNLADSTIYFADAFRQGFSLTDCQRVTLTNFTIDFLKPPYTYVRLASVNPAQRLLVYPLLPNWDDPATFNGGVAAGAPLVLWAVAFRDGQIVPGTSRMHVSEPIANNVIQLIQDYTPWTQGATLSTLQPGDTLVVTKRGGPPPVIATRGDSIVVRNVTIYGSSAFGLFLNSVSNSMVDHVCVVPRPATFSPPMRMGFTSATQDRTTMCATVLSQRHSTMLSPSILFT